MTRGHHCRHDRLRKESHVMTREENEMIERELVYEIKEMKAVGANEVLFIIDIIDEYTLQQLEQRYLHPNGKLIFDGGRTFQLHLTAPIKGLAEKDPAMWQHMLKTKPEIVHAFVLGRLKGEI